MPNAAPDPETPRETWTRWQRETELRAQQFNDSLPSRDASELPVGIAVGPSVQDIANRGSDGRY